jgi:glucose/arabinose dehydrogenase
MLTAKGVFGEPLGHRNRDLEIGPDGQLFVGVGSAGNIGIEPEPKATIQRFSASGQNQKTIATGVRNPTGLAFHPDTGALWAVVQERDNMGDRLVPDYLAQIEEGDFYGWPHSYIGDNPQPEFVNVKPGGEGAAEPKDAKTPPLLFEAHSAAMDLVFYEGDMFPEEYQGDAIVALKGSWNRSQPTGYKLVRVPFEDGKPSGGYENFMTGFWVGGDDKAQVWGRPADVALAPDGALYIVDDTGGTIWRVTYRRNQKEASAAEAD